MREHTKCWRGLSWCSICNKNLQVCVAHMGKKNGSTPLDVVRRTLSCPAGKTYPPMLGGLTFNCSVIELLRVGVWGYVGESEWFFTQLLQYHAREVP